MHAVFAVYNPQNKIIDVTLSLHLARLVIWEQQTRDYQESTSGSLFTEVNKLIKNNGWLIQEGSFTPLNPPDRVISKPPKAKKRVPRCHCCKKRPQDPHDPERRCGHADCIPV